MHIQSSTKFSSVRQNEYILLYMHELHFMCTHMSLVNMFLPEGGPYEAKHVADYNNM